jgi:hypothetical protein
VANALGKPIDGSGGIEEILQLRRWLARGRVCHEAVRGLTSLIALRAGWTAAREAGVACRRCRGCAISRHPESVDLRTCLLMQCEDCRDGKACRRPPPSLPGHQIRTSFTPNVRTVPLTINTRFIAKRLNWSIVTRAHAPRQGDARAAGPRGAPLRLQAHAVPLVRRSCRLHCHHVLIFL